MLPRLFGSIKTTHYLITNWHVVTGRNAETGAYIKSHAGRPNKIRALFNFRDQIFEKQPIDITIRDEDDRPLWFVHPSRGWGVDVVAIPLPYTGSEPTFDMHPINSLSAPGLSIKISFDVFVLGYPFGVEPPGYPVWKRGSIASEPELVRLGPPYLLIDTASRPGMSGAPVIRRSWSDHMVEGSYSAMNHMVATKFVGVYSGRRQTKDPSDAQLGIVWPESYINEIIVGGKYDDSF
jgi:Trypsin-like peptidase domain